MRLSTMRPMGTRRNRIPMSLVKETGASASLARSQVPKKFSRMNAMTREASKTIPKTK